MEKTYQELKKMNKEELLDYIFITQDKELLSRICIVEDDILEYMPLEEQRKLVLKRINDMDILELYFRINKIFYGFECEVAYFIINAKNHIKNLSYVPKDISDQAKYVVFDLDTYEDDFCNEYYKMDNIRLLDESKRLLDVASDEINEYKVITKYATTLDGYLGDGLIGYLLDKFGDENIEIKLNY